MSRVMTNGYNVDASLASGSTTWSIFFWIRAADIQPPSPAWLNQKIGNTDATAIQMGSNAVSLQQNWGAYSSIPATLSNDTWYPMMFDNNTSTNTSHLYIGDTGTYTPVTKNQTNSCVLDQARLRYSSTNNVFNIAEVCIWDRVLTQSDYETLTTLAGGTYPNPTTIHDTDIVAYTSFLTDTSSSDFGTESITWSNGGNTTYSALHPNVDAYSSGTIVPATMNYYMNMMRG